ncbi:unnamed protein product [Triticum turgidum subsp. durum]|uniref:Nudix hydrolase domain-containing protein n=1 Tax=Triticum turgidum subsp. durum TaxID=4567 RepID=A0A9R0Z7K7_TRITD|nr:unnamed protein product [Triticum turgidum subsp. durum]
MAAMMVAARQGRELQRYSASTGGRIVVGCIPYRVRDEAARREALEEAGVRGETGPSLGRWCYQSRRYEATYEGYMFPLRVTDELERWPEMSGRGRTWVTVQDAMDRCPHLWMREALQRFADRVADAAL